MLPYLVEKLEPSLSIWLVKDDIILEILGSYNLKEAGYVK